MANLNGLKKYHFIYKTTNLKNGKFYVGMHSTNNLNDGYLGSGKRLKRSIKKYGVENFKLEILEFFDSRELLVEREKQLVNEELLKDTNCMNLKTGGMGGFSNEMHRNKFLQAAKLTNLLCLEKGHKTSSYLWKTDTEWSDNMRKVLSKNFKHSKRFEGKSHTEETKKKMSEAKKEKYNGSNNPQFGTMWITNGAENKKIKKEETIPIGWKAGRIC
jgi:group I intron endonuclease